MLSIRGLVSVKRIQSPAEPLPTAGLRDPLLRSSRVSPRIRECRAW